MFWDFGIFSRLPSRMASLCGGGALIVGAVFLAPSPAAAQLDVGPRDLYVRVVDVGPGLCVIAEIPGQYYLVYDAGHWIGGQCAEAVDDIVNSEQIQVLVISHPDSDHLGDAAAILEKYEVHQIWRTGYQRFGTVSWEAMNDAVAEEAKYGATVINLQTTEIEPGEALGLGAATLSFLAGWGEWSLTSGPTPAEMRNVISIVARLEFAGRSILLTGDTIGRRLGDDSGACKDAESWMVEHVKRDLLDADVIVAPHHGADNGSATCFIAAVSPEFVVFSAGSQHQHPSRDAAKRYIAAGVAADKMFRTDRGDQEPGGSEWEGGNGHTPDGRDARGDDDVEIIIQEDGSVVVRYRSR